MEALAYALQASAGDPARKVLLLAYANCAGQDGFTGSVSDKYLARLTELGQWQIDPFTRDLEARGYVRRAGRSGVFRVALDDATRDAWMADYQVRAHDDQDPGK